MRDLPTPGKFAFAAITLGCCGFVGATAPQPLRAGVFLDCGGTYSAKVLFDKPFSTHSSTTEYVVNGGFEQPHDESDFKYYVYYGALPGWTSMSNIDLSSAPQLGVGYDVPEGTQAVDLNGGGAGSIQQTLATPAGVPVRLSLKYTFNSNPSTTSPALRQAQILWNGVPVDTLTWDAAAQPVRTWKTFALDLVSKGSDVLRLQSLIGGNAGIMVDQISVTSQGSTGSVLGTSVANLHQSSGAELPSISIPGASVGFDAAGTTATFPLGTLPANSTYQGTLAIQIGDGSGSWNSATVAAQDSIGPWLDSAKVASNLLGGSTDSVFFWTSEPVTSGPGWSFLLDRRGSSGTTSLNLPVTIRLWNAASNEYLALVPANQLGIGDSIRLNPATVADLHGSAALDCHRDVPLKLSVYDPSVAADGIPLYGWFRDVGGRGTANQAVVVFSAPPKARAGLLFLWPAAAGGFDTVSIDSGTWSVGPDGVTATFPVGSFQVGVTSSPTNDLGRWISEGTWNFPMYDSVPPVLTSAMVRYASDDSIPDTLHVRWSEPINWTGAGTMLRHLFRGIQNPVPAQAPSPWKYDPDNLGATFLVAADSIPLKPGDSVAFSEATVSDHLRNKVGSSTRWVPLSFGPRPVRIGIRTIPFMDGSGPSAPPGNQAQIWVRKRGGGPWLHTDGSLVRETGPKVGAVVTANTVLGGTAYIFDNAGVFAASGDLSTIATMADRNLLPTDPSGRYEIMVAWDGRTQSGDLAVSGIYVVRLVLLYHTPDTIKTKVVNKVFRVGIKRHIE